MPGSSTSTTSPSASTLAAPGRSAWKILAGDIKIAHSVFALPFALLGAVIARPANRSAGAFAGQLILIVLCMTAARTAAMLANRLIDRDLDAANPRTAGRALPSRRAAASDAARALASCAIIFIILCIVFGFAFDNWAPTLLSVPVLLWITAYPWMKRFTSLCHLHLGTALAMAPICTGLAIAGWGALGMPALWLMAGNVACWVAGFDVIYAMQDVESDRALGLRSMPSRLGVRGALAASRGLHAASLAMLAGVMVVEPRLRSMLFAGAVGLAGALLVVQHVLAAGAAKTGQTPTALFMLNGLISCVVGAAGIGTVAGG